MTEPIDKIVQTIDDMAMELAHSMFAEWVIQFLWIFLLGWLVQSFFADDTSSKNEKESSPQNLARFFEGRCHEDLSVVVYHPTRKDLLEIQTSKWTQSGAQVIVVHGSLSKAYLQWASQKERKHAVFLQADILIDSKTADLLVYRSRTEQCWTRIPHLDEAFGLHASQGHSLFSNVISKRLSIPACANGIADHSEFENVFQNVFRVPTRIVPNESSVSYDYLSNDNSFDFAQFFQCKKLLQHSDA